MEPLAGDASKASGLNSANADALSAGLVDTGSSVALRSDADEQLLLYVPFKRSAVERVLSRESAPGDEGG